MGHDYEYDVYLSFTGADRDLKNDIFARLKGLGYNPYDSDSYCMGQFRQNYMEALDKSRVYLMILTDNLRNDPAISGRGTLSEVRKELSVACELEAKNQLNIVILCMSQFFRFADGFHDYNDTIGWLYYTHTRGFSMVYGDLAEGGLLSDRAFHDIETRARVFIEKRNAGTPVISQAPKIEIATENLTGREGFVGREGEIARILDAFRGGKQIVVLSGLGGMGKTTLATEVAAKCHREGLLRCPQIVHIQELGGARGALHTVVSSVSYTKEVYDALSCLGDRDRYERKLKALAELPENILLVVDNFNSLRADELRDLLEKLSCRILITTRVTGIPTTDRVDVIQLSSMDEDTARSLFSIRLGREVTPGEFLPLYRFTGGHTITLCMIAKMLAVHGMSIDTMLTALREEGDVGARVEFRHNEYGDSDTVLGHLGKLYDMSNFGEGERRILSAMSILSDGTIPTAALMRILSLPYKNEILELARLGWLEILRGEEELLYLHPILSHMAARLLPPSAASAAPMIDYLLDGVRAAGKTMTYADATVLSERLYYAIHVLGVADGTLHAGLWDAYVSIDSLLCDADGARARSAALAPRLQDWREAAMVTSYADMRVLEQDPTRIELLETYINELYENADNYKWVMRALSVTAEFLSGVPDCAESLGNVLERAIDAAIARKDDFAVSDLAAYTIGTPSFPRIITKLGKYLRTRRGAAATGALYCLKQAYTSFRTAHRSGRGVFEESAHTVDVFGNGRIGRQIAYALSHIPALIRGAGLLRLAKEIPEEDPLRFYVAGANALAEQIISEGVIDARAYIEMAVNLHIYRTEQGYTLASTAKAIEEVIEQLDAYSVPKIKSELSLLCEEQDDEEIGVVALARLQVATIVSAFLGDDAAIEQSRRALEAVSRIRPEGHTDLVYAIVCHADNLARFGRKEEALALYAEAYRTLAVQAKTSAPLAAIARSMLPLLSIDDGGEAIASLYETAITDLDDTRYLFSETLYRYASLVIRSVEEKKIGLTHPSIRDVMRRLAVAAEGRKRLTRSAATEMLATIHMLGVFFVAQGAPAEPMYREVLHLLDLFCKGTPRIIRANAGILKTELTEGVLARRASGCEVCGHHRNVIRACVENHMQSYIAAGKLSNILGFVASDKTQSAYTENLLRCVGITGKAFENVRYECFLIKSNLFEPYVKRIEELGAVKQERVLSIILARELSLHAKRLASSGYGINYRAFCKIRSVSAYSTLVIRTLLAAIYETYRDDPPRYAVRPEDFGE